jgi:hypothetical protein
MGRSNIRPQLIRPSESACHWILEKIPFAVKPVMAFRSGPTKLSDWSFTSIFLSYTAAVTVLDSLLTTKVLVDWSE